MLTKRDAGAVVFVPGIDSASIGYLGIEKSIFGISLTIRLVLNYDLVHHDTLLYLGMCSFSSFEHYKQWKRSTAGPDLRILIFHFQVGIFDFFEFDFRTAESISCRIKVPNSSFD